MNLPVLRIAKAHEKSLRSGVPWIMRHQSVESSEWMTAQAGELVRVESERGDAIGIGMVNPLSHIVCRVLGSPRETIDQCFFEHKISQALAKRDALYDAPYYRLLHAEADGLPGLIIDRFDDLCVIQVGSAGMERLQPLWLGALEALLAPRAILLRNDFGARTLEGLSRHVICLKGQVSDCIEVLENGCTYFADVLRGQKTGWFYDMRDNRRMVAELAKGKKLLDVFSHSGGFGVLAAKAGAQVTLVDSSALALELAMRAAKVNHITCHTLQGDAVEVMQKLAADGARYDIVIADPPAYVKNKKDVATGLKGYQKVAAHAAMLVAPHGYLFTASCSHHAGRSAFNKSVMDGVAQAGRKASIVKQTGAGKDHPLHPRLPQSEYLKGLLLQLD